MKRMLGIVLVLPAVFRRLWFVYRARLLSRLMRVDLDIHVDPRVRIGRNVVLKLQAGNPITIHIGPNVEIEDDVRIEVRNGIGHDPTLWIEGNVVIHSRAFLYFGGTLLFKGKCEIGVGTVIRCSQYIEWGDHSGSGEYASVFDFLHAADDNKRITYQTVLISQPVKIGSWVIIAAKATVNPGSTISDMTVVAPNAVVSGTHSEPSIVLAGIPAKPLGKLGMFPLMQNPFIEAVTSWVEDHPGPGFKTVEEAKATVPDPTPYDKAEHGWDALVRRLEELERAKAQNNGGSAPARSPGGAD